MRARTDASPRSGFAATNEAWSASASQLRRAACAAESGAPATSAAAGRPRRSRRGTRVLAALLPLRFFFGVTFLYAGLDKLLDPGFFDAAGRRLDPGPAGRDSSGSRRIGPLVHLVEPLAVPIGFLIAFAEIAIGLGALTGLAYRLAAAAGVALSLLFWLTASWTTTPYYFGPDLPYAVGWLTLALAGHGGLLVVRPAWLGARARPSPGVAALAGAPRRWRATAQR